MLSLLLLFSALARAELPKINIFCGNSMSSASVYTEDGRVYFRLEDAIGNKNFPLYEGVVNSYLVSILERAKEDLKAFDHSVLISWDASQCRADAKKPFLVDCSGRAKIHSPEIKTITSSGISVGLEQASRLDFSYERVKIDLGLDTVGADYQHYFVAFPFNKQNCSAH